MKRYFGGVEKIEGAQARAVLAGSMLVGTRGVFLAKDEWPDGT